MTTATIVTRIDILPSVVEAVEREPLLGDDPAGCGLLEPRVCVLFWTWRRPEVMSVSRRTIRAEAVRPSIFRFST